VDSFVGAGHRKELRRRPKYDYLFRNKIFCGLCGGKLYGGTRLSNSGKELRRYQYSNKQRRCIDGKQCRTITENTLIAHVIPSIMRLCLMQDVWKRGLNNATSRDQEIGKRIRDEKKIIEKLRKDLKRNEYGFFHGIISESTTKEIKEKLEPQLELHQKNIETLNQKILSDEEAKLIKKRLIHWNLSLNNKSGKEFNEQLILVAWYLLDRLYIDSQKKEVLITLRIPEFNHSVKIGTPLDEKFFKSPIVAGVLDKEYVLYRAYQLEGSTAIEQSSIDQCSIKTQNTKPVKGYTRLSKDEETKKGQKPVKYSFTIPYSRVNGRWV